MSGARADWILVACTVTCGWAGTALDGDPTPDYCPGCGAPARVVTCGACGTPAIPRSIPTPFGGSILGMYPCCPACGEQITWIAPEPPAVDRVPVGIEWQRPVPVPAPNRATEDRK